MIKRKLNIQKMSVDNLLRLQRTWIVLLLKLLLNFYHLPFLNAVMLLYGCSLPFNNNFSGGVSFVLCGSYYYYYYD